MHEIVYSAGLEYPNYDSVDISSHSDVGPIHKFRNIKIGKSKEKLFLDGEWMVIANPYYYGHYLQEAIAPMIFYKKYINPDLKVLWLNQDVDANAHDSNSFMVIGEESRSILSSESDVFMNLDEFISKEIVFMNLVSFFYSSRFVPGLEIKNYTFKDLYQHNNVFLNRELRNFYLPKVEINSSFPKKIFLSRKKRSSLIESFNDGKDSLRYAPGFYHNAIEDFFKLNDYRVLELAGMTVLEQASYIANAEEIAGISGTAFLNGIFAREGAKFNMILSEKNYTYRHQLDALSVAEFEFNFIEMYDKINYDQVYFELLEKVKI
jgi:hypothetical protein